MNLTDRIIGACIEPMCAAEDVAVRVLDAVVARWDRLTEPVRAWCDVDRELCRWARETGGDDE